MSPEALPDNWKLPLSAGVDGGVFTDKKRKVNDGDNINLTSSSRHLWYLKKCQGVKMYPLIRG